MSCLGRTSLPSSSFAELPFQRNGLLKLYVRLLSQSQSARSAPYCLTSMSRSHSLGSLASSAGCQPSVFLDWSLWGRNWLSILLFCVGRVFHVAFEQYHSSLDWACSTCTASRYLRSLANGLGWAQCWPSSGYDSLWPEVIGFLLTPRRACYHAGWVIRDLWWTSDPCTRGSRPDRRANSGWSQGFWSQAYRSRSKIVPVLWLHWVSHDYRAHSAPASECS